MNILKKYMSILVAVLICSSLSSNVFATVSAHEDSSESTESETVQSESVDTTVSDEDVSEENSDDATGENSELIQESADEVEDALVDTETDEVLEENYTENYEIVANVTTIENNFLSTLVLVGYCVIAVGVIGLIVSLILLSQKKPKQSKRSQKPVINDAYEFPVMHISKTEDENLPNVFEKKEIVIPVETDSELNKKVDFSKLAQDLKKPTVKQAPATKPITVPKNKTPSKVSIYDTQDILNEFLN
ncbi:MAG: hypothetical protein R3Y35_00435 [Clostridia bacterium]